MLYNALDYARIYFCTTAAIQLQWYLIYIEFSLVLMLDFNTYFRYYTEVTEQHS